MGALIVGRNDANGLIIESVDDNGKTESAAPTPLIVSGIDITLGPVASNTYYTNDYSGITTPITHNVQTVQIQLKDQNNNPISGVFPVSCWLTQPVGFQLSLGGVQNTVLSPSQLEGVIQPLTTDGSDGVIIDNGVFWNNDQAQLYGVVGRFLTNGSGHLTVVIPFNLATNSKFAASCGQSYAVSSDFLTQTDTP
jgi:hypothetical protein